MIRMQSSHLMIIWSCQNVSDFLSSLLDNIFIRFGTKLYSVNQMVRIPMCTNCAPLVADCRCCVMKEMSLSDDTRDDINKDLNFTSRYLDDLLNLNIGNHYFEEMTTQMCPIELQILLIKKPHVLDLHLIY